MRSVLLHRRESCSWNEGHGGRWCGRTRPRRSCWAMARSHAPIAIAMRIVTVETVTSRCPQRPARTAVVYYSARGNVHAPLRAAAQGCPGPGSGFADVVELNESRRSPRSSTGARTAPRSRMASMRAEVVGHRVGRRDRLGCLLLRQRRAAELFLDLAGELAAGAGRQGRDGRSCRRTEQWRQELDDPPQQHLYDGDHRRLVHGRRGLQRGELDGALLHQPR